MAKVDYNKKVLPPAIEVPGFPVTLAFTNDGRAFLSERITGRLWELRDEDFRLVKTFPVVPIIGHHETGLLGVALDPDFEANRYIYCYYTYGKDQRDFRNKVVRVRDDGSGEEVLLDNLPAGWIHNGGIIAFAPDKLPRAESPRYLL